MENLVKDTSKMRGHHPKSEFKKGCVPWNKGLSGWISKKHLEKLRQSNIGKIVWNKGLYGINSGESNPNWKGGYHDKEHGLRRTQEWKKWRLDVFNRDDYTCRQCGAKSGKDYDGIVYLEAHHRIGVHDLFKNNFNNYIFNMDNGLTLCKECHLLISANQRRLN